MSDNTIRQGILELLERECSILDFDNLWSSEELEALTATWLSDHFQCSRNLISHYMSELQQKGQIIKINTRPVYFFLRKSLEERFSVQLQSDIYETLEEMRNELKAADKKHAFMNLIGAQDSLSYVESNAKQLSPILITDFRFFYRDLPEPGKV